MKTDELVNHTIALLNISKKLLSQNPSLTKKTGATNTKGDQSIEMDIAIEKELIRYIKKQNIPANIFSEEIGTVKFHNNPNLLITLDPLDGSTNYKIGQKLLPFGTLVSIYKGTNPKLIDVIVAGALEHSHNLGWIFNGKNTLTLKGKRVYITKTWKINRSTPIYLDLYYKNGYAEYSPLPEQVFVRNTGSTIGNLSYTLSGISAGLGGVCMRAEEIGAVYSLVKGAGGIVIDHEKNDLGNRAFSPDHTYSILAGSKNVIEFVADKIK